MLIYDLSYNREKAILIYNGKIYESEDNHQYALKEALADNNDSIENYVDYDNAEESENFIERNLNELIEYTDNKSSKNELFTFDNFDNKYLIAHYKSNLDLNMELIREYAEKNNLIVGYFSDIKSKKCELIKIN